MSGFARDIGEEVRQSIASLTSTGDKYFGEAAKRGNPNLIQNSSTVHYAVIAVAVLLALWILIGSR